MYCWPMATFVWNKSCIDFLLPVTYLKKYWMFGFLFIYATLSGMWPAPLIYWIITLGCKICVLELNTDMSKKIASYWHCLTHREAAINCGTKVPRVISVRVYPCSSSEMASLRWVIFGFCWPLITQLEMSLLSMLFCALHIAYLQPRFFYILEAWVIQWGLTPEPFFFDYRY